MNSTGTQRERALEKSEAGEGRFPEGDGDIIGRKRRRRSETLEGPPGDWQDRGGQRGSPTTRYDVDADETNYPVKSSSDATTLKSPRTSRERHRSCGDHLRF